MAKDKPTVSSDEEVEQEIVCEIFEQSHLPLLMALGDLEMVRDETRQAIRTFMRHMNACSERRSPLTVTDALQISEQATNIIISRLVREVSLLKDCCGTVQATYGATKPTGVVEECSTDETSTDQPQHQL